MVQPRALTVSAAISIAVVLCLTLVGLPTAAESPAAESGARIGIRVVDGDGEFYEVATGETWVPRGTNLMRFDRGGPEAPFGTPDYDPRWIEAQLDDLAAKGYNAVRVFFEMCVADVDCTAGPGERLSPEFLARAAEFLRLAGERGIHVMYSSNTLPTDSWYVWEGYPEGDSDFISTTNVEIYRHFFRDFVEGLIEAGAPMDWLWSLEIRNEYQYLTADWPPWNRAAGEFTAANGQTYDMAVQADRRRLSSEGLLYWADEMNAVIKSVDPELLVSIGLLLPSGDVRRPGSEDQRKLYVGAFHERTTVDFFDVHGILPSVQEARDRFSLPASREKPVIIGEFAGDWATPDVVAWVASRWQSRTCRAGFDGWLTWHWQWVADTEIDAALAPREHPDPCVRVEVEIRHLSFGRKVRASRTEGPEYRPANLVDGDPESYWSAAAGGPQWFEVDLGRPATVGSFRLPIGIVTPRGRVDIRVQGKGPGTNGRYRQLHRFKLRIKPGDVVEHTLRKPARGIRYVRFVVEDMANEWVILHEVEIWRAE